MKKNIKMALGGTGIIKVEDFEFHIAKGWHEAEHKVENHFKVSAEVVYEREKLPAGSFLDYEDLAAILKRHMISDTHLLETIAEQILEDIARQWPYIKSARVVIRKLTPAFTHMKIGAVVVERQVAY